MIKITEAPRDAMQGVKKFIPTKVKAELINALLKVGFDIIDFGSFVSPKAIPQLKDTVEVLKMLELTNSETKLMSIVGNLRGTETASGFDEISYLGFPFSFSETFLKLNLNLTIEESKKIISQIQDKCLQRKKELIIYIAMAFGNPYNDTWSMEKILKWAHYFLNQGIKTIVLSDITGHADGKLIGEVYKNLSSEFPETEFGLHLHTKKTDWYEKIDEAFKNGCRIFDGVTNGYGGCPMTGYQLIGNLDTRNIINYCNQNKIDIKIDMQAFKHASDISSAIFSTYH